MNELSMAEKINQLRKSPVRVYDIKSLGANKAMNKEAIIEFALSCNPELKDFDISELARELASRDDFYIEIGNKKVTATELREDVVESLENPINVNLAHSWIDRGKEVIGNMTDNDITARDIVEREEFFNDISSRQAELETMLAMYQTNSLPNASTMIARIQKRLAELEKVKTVVRKATREAEQAIANQEITQTEQTKAKMYLGVLDYMQNDKNIPDNMKVKLELNGGVDFSYSLSEEIYKNRSLSNKNQIIDRISQLRGRQQTNNVAKSELRNLQFDKDMYRQMMQKKLEQQNF